MMSGTGLLFVLAMLLPLPSAARQAQPPAGPRPCRADTLVSWNCAGLFSGSFGWKSVLRGGAAGGAQVNIQEDVTVGITFGAATCVGTRTGTTRTANGETRLIFTINGPGLVAVEYGTNTEDDPKGPYYQITVACPSPAGEEIHTDFASGNTTVLKRASVWPKAFDGDEMSSYKRSGTQKDLVLQGSTVDEHPEADAANLLTGTVTTTWKLVKKG